MPGLHQQQLRCTTQHCWDAQELLWRMRTSPAPTSLIMLIIIVVVVILL